MIAQTGTEHPISTFPPAREDAGIFAFEDPDYVSFVKYGY